MLGREPACDLIRLRKAGKPLDTKGTREVVADYLTWQVVVNGGGSILGALELEERYRISFWDALLIQAAQASGAEVLYSEDLSDRQQYGPVRVVNPLIDGPNTPSPRAIRLRDNAE